MNSISFENKREFPHMRDVHETNTMYSQTTYDRLINAATEKQFDKVSLHVCNRNLSPCEINKALMCFV